MAARPRANRPIFLLTPLREGRHSKPCGKGGFECQISTHAPAGGATAGAAAPGPPLGISTHAPAGGATAAWGKAMEGTTYFYSRPCGRGDQPSEGALDWCIQFLLTPLREGRQARV